MERNLTTSKEFHFDPITNNILQILPAKSLVRFTSACKTWYEIIKSPQFITSHLNRRDAKSHQVLILGERLCHVLENQNIIQHITLDFYIDNFGLWDTPIGSCNGLIFMPIRPSCDREYLLWNPSIRKMYKLELEVDIPYYEKCDWVMFNYEIFGLGFHKSANDHRVVRIHYVIDDRTSGIGHVPTKVDVYSLCTNLWHRVYSSPAPFIGSSRGVFINGVIHWLATTHFTTVTSTPEDDRFESILLFDIENESFGKMTLPENLHYTVDRMMVFDAFKGSLAAIIIEVTPSSSMFVLWVMTDYGVIESWTKKFRIIDKETRIQRWPLGLLRCGILVYFEKGHKKLLVFVDVDSGEAKNMEWLMDSAEVMDFMDSLVLFQG